MLFLIDYFLLIYFFVVWFRLFLCNFATKLCDRWATVNSHLMKTHIFLVGSSAFRQNVDGNQKWFFSGQRQELCCPNSNVSSRTSCAINCYICILQAKVSCNIGQTIHGSFLPLSCNICYSHVQQGFINCTLNCFTKTQKCLSWGVLKYFHATVWVTPIGVFADAYPGHIYPFSYPIPILWIFTYFCHLAYNWHQSDLFQCLLLWSINVCTNFLAQKREHFWCNLKVCHLGAERQA
jgi:hypothetical protein